MAKVGKSRVVMIPASLRKRAARFISLFSLSWFIVAFGQPARFPLLCPLAAACGFALFWIAMKEVSSRRFWWASLWYCCVQLIQLSWFTSIEFQGYYILGVYAFLCIALGLQFGVLTQFILTGELQNSFARQNRPFEAVYVHSPRWAHLGLTSSSGPWQHRCHSQTASKSSIFPGKAVLQLPLTGKKILAAASLLTLMEWTRLFVFCGFSWNPVGLAMTGNHYSMQLANIWGIYGLSFWVILVNAFLYFAWVSRQIRQLLLWACLAIIPYLYGFLCLSFLAPDSPSRSVSIGLVQTGLLPSQKVHLPGRWSELIEPLDQWKKIFSTLQEQNRSWDLLVFPEAVVPMRADYCCYPYSEVLEAVEPLSAFHPSLIFPFAQYHPFEMGRLLCVSNIFLAQVVANRYKAEVVIGLDHYDPVSRSYYNSAFHCAPQSEQIQRYDKQVLLPLAEYLPFSWLQSLTKSYGITAFFSHGRQSKVLGKTILMSPSICYEETFPHVIRQGRKQGAELLVNVTNDNYYPFSQLPEQHLTHARVRAVENGVPLVRACNTGVTAAVDRFGRIVARFEGETTRGMLSIDLALDSHKTIYLLWGDAGIIGLACCSLLMSLFCIRVRVPLYPS